MAITLDGTTGIITPGNVTVSGSGVGVIAIVAPNTATNQTLTLPDATTTLVGTDATQLLSNKFFIDTNTVVVSTPTGTARIDVGAGRTGDGPAFIDLVGDTTYSDYGARIIRQGTSAGASTLTHRGTGSLEITAEDAAPIVFKTTNTERMRIDSGGLITQVNATSGRGAIVGEQTFRLASNGSALGPTIADFFGATSSISLEASSVYQITAYCVFTKTTAGTITWTMTASSAPTRMVGTYNGSPVTGIAAGALISGFTGSQGATTAAFAATASLTTAVNHAFQITMQVQTNAATSWELQITNSAGTATPLAGSYYTVKKISASTGTFV